MRTKILNRGADICLEKPLDEREVLAVINAVLRRSARFVRGPVKLAPCIVRKDLSIDPLRRTVIMEGRQVTLTSKEFDILYFLASYPGIVFSKGQKFERMRTARQSEKWHNYKSPEQRLKKTACENNQPESAAKSSLKM